MFRTRIGNAARLTNPIDFRRRFNTPQRVNGDTDHGRPQFRLPTTRRLPTDLRAFKTDRLQIFRRDNLIHQRRQPLLPAEQMYAIPVRARFYIGVITSINQNMRMLTADQYKP